MTSVRLGARAGLPGRRSEGDTTVLQIPLLPWRPHEALRTLAIVSLVILLLAFLDWNHGSRGTLAESMRRVLVEWEWFLLLGAAAGIGVALAAASARRIGVALIDLRGAEVCLPRVRICGCTTRLPYTDLVGIQRVGAGSRGRLIVAARRRLPFFVEASSLADPADLQRLEDALLDGIGRGKSGPRQLALVGRSRCNWDRIRGTRPWLTGGVAVALAAAHAYQHSIGWTHGSLPGLLGGAKASWNIAERGVDLIFTPSFLHHDVVHLGMNLASLIPAGWVAEAFIGRARMWVLLGITGLTTTVATLTWVSGASVGASGMIYGLVGLLLWLNLVRRGELPVGIRWSPFAIAAAAAVEVGVALLIPQVNWQSHVTGLVTGLVAAAWMFGRRPIADIRLRKRSGWAWIAGALALVYAAAAVKTAASVGEAGEATRQARFERLMFSSDLDLAGRARFAELALAGPKVERRYLEINAALARRVLSRSAGSERWEQILLRSERRLASRTR